MFDFSWPRREVTMVPPSCKITPASTRWSRSDCLSPSEFCGTVVGEPATKNLRSNGFTPCLGDDPDCGV